MALKLALIKNGLSGAFGKTSTVIIRLIQVPLLLSMLGVNEYGLWIVISSIPVWLSIANLGFGNVALIEVVLQASSGNLKKANQIYSSSVFFISIMSIVGSLLSVFVLHFFDFATIFNIARTRNSEIYWTFVFLIFTVFSSFFTEVFTSRFKVAEKTYMSILLIGFRAWIDLVFIIIALHVGKGLNFIALSLLCSSVVSNLLIMFLSYKVYPAIYFSTGNIYKSYFKMLFGKGVAYQAFPIGNALLFQGNILIVQSVLGPIAVAIFSTTRTLVRSVNQLMELVNQVVWPELCIVFGKGDLEKARTLHRSSLMISFSFAVFGTVFLAFFGSTIYDWWTNNTLIVTHSLLLLFLIPIPFNALWYTSSVVHIATNKHEALAIRYLVASGLSAIICLILSILVGIEGAALSTLLVDIILIPFVFKKSLYLTEDSPRNFISGCSVILLDLIKRVKYIFV